MSFRFVNLMCTLTFALACGSSVVDAGKLPDDTGTGDGNVSEFVDAGSQVVPAPSTPDAGAAGGPGCTIPDLGRYRLVFDSDGGKLERRIYSMRADGAELEPLTPPGELAREPALSPDGQTLAYVTPDGIRLLSMATGQSELLVPGGSQPSWSADGQRLFHQLNCAGSDGGNCTVNAVLLADRSIEPFFSGGDQPELSSDGSTLVYQTTYRPDSITAISGVAALDMNDRHGWFPVLETRAQVFHPTISGDNVWLAAAIECPNEQGASLWVSPLVVSTSPCEGHRVTPAGAASVSNPKWGPGNLIAYERATPPRDIAIVSADTGEECVLQGPGDDRNPSWAPLVDFSSPQ